MRPVIVVAVDVRLSRVSATAHEDQPELVESAWYTKYFTTSSSSGAVQDKETAWCVAVPERALGASGYGVIARVLSYAPKSGLEPVGFGLALPAISTVGAFMVCSSTS